MQCRSYSLKIECIFLSCVVVKLGVILLVKLHSAKKQLPFALYVIRLVKLTPEVLLVSFSSICHDGWWPHHHAGQSW
jgi:hypothetical protein